MEFLEQFVPNGIIVVICLIAGHALKWLFDGRERLLSGIPWMLAVLGAVLGLIAMGVMTEFAALDPLTAIAMGAVSGFAAGGVYQTYKQHEKLK